MRRFIIALLIAALMPLYAAFSEALPDSDYIYCMCGQEQCVCFLQYEDTGFAVRQARQLLLELGYLEKRSPVEKFDYAMYEAVLRFQYDCGIYESGMLDDVTLTALYMTDPEYPITTNIAWWYVYVPINGGKKLHCVPTCSNMIQPRVISAMNAEYLCMVFEDTDLCKKCLKRE